MTAKPLNEIHFKVDDAIRLLFNYGFIFGGRSPLGLIFKHHDFKTDHELFLIESQTFESTDFFTERQLEHWAIINQAAAKYMAIKLNGSQEEKYAGYR